MPEFVIKTHNDRNIVIKADRYEYNATEESYEFFRKDDQANTTRVATLPRHAGPFLIADNSVVKSDSYSPRELETSNLARTAQTPETEPTATGNVDPIQHWRDKDGNEWWGFHTPKGFVHCGNREFACSCYQTYQEAGSNMWAYLDLTGATRLS